MYYIKNKVLIITIIFLAMLFLVSCDYKNAQQYNINNNTTNNIKINSESSVNKENVTKIKILGKETISINNNRINDDVYGTGSLDNRWNLSEIDAILTALKGDWKIDKYVGFVDSGIYYPDLFDPHNNIGEDIRNNLNKMYDEKVSTAKKNIPKASFSIKEFRGKETSNNYIYVNDYYPSPISIILSIDRLNDNYPIFVNRTTISSDFFVEYPVLYIKIFIPYEESNKETWPLKYEPATLVISSDNKFYILIDGAFYSLLKI